MNLWLGAGSGVGETPGGGDAGLNRVRYCYRFDLRSLARAHTAMGIKVLAGIASAENAPPAARVSAAVALLDRGWGKPEQSHVGLDGGDIHVVIRQIIDSAEEPEPLLIEHETPRD